MPKLIECSGCTRHVRADDGQCPFCGRPSTTSAPSLMLVLALPLTLMACTAEGPAPAPKTDAKASPTEPVKKTEPADGGAVIDPVPEPDDRVRAPEYGAPPPEPADGGAVIDPVPEPDDRVMATKYGGPPVMNDPVPTPDSIETAKPEEPRPAKKYGAPPRPAPKYGGAPKPGAGDPLGE
jgi:hypothetical protein